MIRSLGGLVRRPDLWPTAFRQARRTAPTGWWKRRPFLPLPAGDYLEFRLVTQYGDARRAPAPDDVVKYLEWCRQWDRSERPRRA